jgi:hypothetical protein
MGLGRRTAQPRAGGGGGGCGVKGEISSSEIEPLAIEDAS